MNQQIHDDLVARFAEFEADHPGPVIELALRPTTAFVVMAALQLALRHPGYERSGSARETVETVARLIADSFPSPIREHALLGFDRSHDVPQATEAGG